MSSAKLVWDKILSLIEDEIKDISPIAYKSFILTAIPHSYNNNHFVLGVPLDFNKEMIEKKYLVLMKNALIMATNNENATMSVEIEGNLKKDESFNKTEEKIPSNTINPTYKEANLYPKFTFNTFVIGESNRFACAASMAVADSPGESYNPLFLYGGVGLGKTHLMHAIGNQILENNPNAKISYITSENFMNELIYSISKSKTNEFRDKYRNLDVLIIDDIQFIGGKDRTQEEFFHTFNHLYQSNKQIILSSDRPPKDISILEDRLRSRFESGLLCDIKAPDLETRIAILRKRVIDEKIDIPDEIIMFIAERVKSNIRELEGVLTRLSAYSQLTKKEISKEMTLEIIKEITDTVVQRIVNVDTIIVETANYFSIDPNELKSNTRKQNIVDVRQIAMYIIREITGISQQKIGEEFGGRNHSTVNHSIEKVESSLKGDSRLKDQINEIITNIKNMM